jgi:PleD family two-component response regulator
MAPISILIADDSAVIRRALVDFLSQEPERWVVCAEAADGPAALEKSQTHRPDVILLDLSLPGLHGAEVAKSLRNRFPDPNRRAPRLIHVGIDRKLFVGKICDHYIKRGLAGDFVRSEALIRARWHVSSKADDRPAAAKTVGHADRDV